MRACGLVHDDATVVTTPDASLYLGSVVSVPHPGDTPSLRGPFRFVQSINDQGESEGCVGFAIKESFEARAAALGLVLPPVSALGVWALARQFAQAAYGVDLSTPLENVGCQPSLAARGISVYGIPGESSFPWSTDPGQYVRKLTLAQLESADGTLSLLLRQWLAITATGQRRHDQIRAALASDHFVPLAIAASGADFQNPGAVIDVDPNGAATNHMVSLVGTFEDGSGDYLLLNHWGPSWGGNGGAPPGMARVTPGRVDQCDSLYVADLAAPAEAA